MRFLINVLFLILMSPVLSFGQIDQYELRFEHVDHHVSQVDKKFIFHPQLLSQNLSEGLTNDYDKVRAFYVWIARNIDYDLLAYVNKTRSGQSINQVMRSGKALCSGFSLLFNYFCQEAGIESVIIEGYAKGHGYRKNQQFEEVNHAWNAVKIYERWYLLDATWAIGNPTNISRHQKKIDVNTFFLTKPEVFIKTHLPEDPTWQLLEQKISLTEFEEDAYHNNNEWPYQAYHPDDYNNMDEYDIGILQLKRAKEFNPKNRLIDPLIAFAYLYKGISITDELWKMDYFQLNDTVCHLEQNFYALMDSALSLANEIDFKKVPYKKNNLLDEVNYQKGVINYELGIEIFSKAKSANIPFTQTDFATKKYFALAEEHFEQTPSTSIYYKDAREYLSLMDEFRLRIINWTSTD